jgi:hypothetical protein
MGSGKPNAKKKNEMVKVSLVEVTKSGSGEKRRVVDGVSGMNVDIEFVGGIWKERKLKFPCPECGGRHTTIELSIQDLGWDAVPHLSKSGGSIESFLGNFTIYCDDCKKLFTFSPSGDINLDYIEEVSYDESKQPDQENSG